MPFPTLLLPILAAAAQPGITVTGHAWAPFISPMGEPFRSRSPGDDTLAQWFAQADRNRDGFLTPDEMQADAERFFATLDTDHDGEIDPDELVRYEWQVAPEIQLGSRERRARGDPAPSKREAKKAEKTKDLGPQGASRYALLDMPEPVAAADADFNRGVSLAEFRQAARARFALLDSGNQGRLSLQQLQALRPAPGQRAKRRKDASDTRIGASLPPGD